VKYAGGIGLALTVVATVGASQSSQGDGGLNISAVRFFRPGSSQTIVDVFCRVPLLLVTPLGQSSGGAFRVAVSVRDSAGLELVSHSWLTPVRGELLRTRGTSTAEHVRFAARPGRYAVAVAVTDSASGASRGGDQWSPSGTRPEARLLLASDLRAGAPGDTAGRPGEVRFGSLFLSTSGEPVLTPQASRLAYYVELYSTRAESLSVAARVVTESGTQVVAVAPTAVAIGAGGGVTDGVVDLAGLPRALPVWNWW
jgi:hypothetical protein